MSLHHPDFYQRIKLKESFHENLWPMHSFLSGFFFVGGREHPSHLLACICFSSAISRKLWYSSWIWLIRAWLMHEGHMSPAWCVIFSLQWIGEDRNFQQLPMWLARWKSPNKVLWLLLYLEIYQPQCCIRKALFFTLSQLQKSITFACCYILWHALPNVLSCCSIHSLLQLGLMGVVVGPQAPLPLLNHMEGWRLAQRLQPNLPITGRSSFA